MDASTPKPTADQVEHIPESYARHEELETEAYSIGWRTLVAVLALCLPNCCAVVTNTVRLLRKRLSPPYKILTARQTNTTISFQVMAVGGAASASWISNGNFLMTLTCGPVLVS